MNFNNQQQEQFIKQISKEYSPKTITQYKSVIRLFNEMGWSVKSLEDIEKDLESKYPKKSTRRKQVSCLSKISKHIENTTAHEFWKAWMEKHNKERDVEARDTLKTETVSEIQEYIVSVKNCEKLNDNQKLLLLLYLQGACVRTDILTVRCDIVGKEYNYVDYDGKSIVFNSINKKGTLKNPIIVNDLDNDTWVLIEKQKGKEFLIEGFSHLNENSKQPTLSRKLPMFTMKAFGKKLGVMELRSLYESNAISNIDENADSAEKVVVRENIAERLGHSVEVQMKNYERIVEKKGEKKRPINTGRSATAETSFPLVEQFREMNMLSATFEIDDLEIIIRKK